MDYPGSSMNGDRGTAVTYTLSGDSRTSVRQQTRRVTVNPESAGQAAGGSNSEAGSGQINDYLLIMHKDLYVAKKNSVENEISNLESRCAAINASVGMDQLQILNQKVQSVEEKVHSLWQERMEVMKLITSPQVAAQEMANGRVTQATLNERVIEL